MANDSKILEILKKKLPVLAKDTKGSLKDVRSKYFIKKQIVPREDHAHYDAGMPGEEDLQREKIVKVTVNPDGVQVITELNVPSSRGIMTGNGVEDWIRDVR